MSGQPRRALIAITSYNEVFYDGGKKTGLYWSEALHPYNVFREAGIEVDVASEKGTFGYDEHSITEEALDPESKDAWNDPKHPLRNQLQNQMLVASQVDPSKVLMPRLGHLHPSLEYAAERICRHCRGLELLHFSFPSS